MVFAEEKQRVAVLRLVVVLLLLLLPLCTTKLNETKRILKRKYQKSVESKEQLERSSK